MNIALTGKKMIASKKGANYVVISGISKRGDAVKAVVLAESASQIAGVMAPTEKEIEALFAKLPVVEVDFNEQGRAEGVYPVDDE